jgi:hypothetical protein
MINSKIKYIEKKSKNLIPYTIKSILCFILIMVIENNFPKANIWFVMLSIYLLSIPIALGGIYLNTVSQIHAVSLYNPSGWLHSLLSRKTLKNCLWGCWALFSSFFMFIQFQFYNDLDWFTFILVIPIFGYVCNNFFTPLSNQTRAYAKYYAPIILSRIIVPIIMLLIYVILSLFVDKVEYSSFDESIKAAKGMTPDITSSCLVKEVTNILSFFKGSENYVIGTLEGNFTRTLLQIVILGIGNLVIFFNACIILTCFFIPRIEYHRIFGPLIENEIPQLQPPSRIAGISAVTIFLSLFLFLQFFGYLEKYAKSPKIEMISERVKEMVAIPAISIEKVLYKKGIEKKIKKEVAEFVQTITSYKRKLEEEEVDHAFKSIESNVDEFLNWYYTFYGEFYKIFGKTFGYGIEEKFKEELQNNNAFKKVEIVYNKMYKAKLEHNKILQELFSEHRINNPDYSLYKVKKIESKHLKSSRNHQDWIESKNKIIISSGVGLGTGVVITNKVVDRINKRVFRKGIFKKLSKRLLIKKSAKKILKTTAKGAAAGSILPGPGTTTGTIAGIAAGIGTEFATIKLDEKFNREVLKKDLLQAIQEAKVELKRGILNNNFQPE